MIRGYGRRQAVPFVAALLAALPAVSVSAAEDDLVLADTPAAQRVRTRLAALLTPLPAGTQVGLVVADVASGECWFAHQARRPLKPASVIKLFVTAAALERFGTDFRYETRVYVHADELRVVGAGDPGLGDERIAQRYGKRAADVFDAWAEALRARDIHALSSIVLDDGIFDRQWRHADWPASQAHTWYQAPVGGLNFNDNCLDSRVRVRNGRVELLLQPDLPPEFLSNELSLGGKHAPCVTRHVDSDVFEFHGPVGRDDELGPTSVRRPALFFGHALRVALEARGIAVRGEIVRRRIAPVAVSGAAPLATHSTSLRDVLWRSNTFSQNFFAECLLKSLAAYGPDGRRTGEPGSWERGEDVLQATLKKLGVALDGAVLRDGSGLSHQNRVTAQQVVKLLATMRQHRAAEVFVGSLAAPGEPGTMRHRYALPELRGRLRGKTGTIQGVQALAGYVSRADGTTLAFALLINGNDAATLPIRVCRALVE